MRKIKRVLCLALSIMICFAGILITPSKTSKANVKSNFGVGEGRKIPDQIFAPYLDFCDYWFDPAYVAGGAPYMPKLSEDTGIKYFNLAFIQASGKGVVDGKVPWAWAGLSVLKEGSTDPQYLGMKKSIKDFRDMGGEVIISFGGRDGIALWQATEDVSALANTYQEIIEGYGCTRIDLDIEGGAQGVKDNTVNAKAMKLLQERTGVEVTLTLPVLPSGLTQTQMDVFEVYLKEGVDIKMINIMAMCYGNNALNPGENYGTGSVRAIDSTMKQIKEYYKKFKGVFLTDKEAYRKVGVTTSVGYESGSDPIFPPEWTKLVTDHAIDKEIGMNSFWSINRDSTLQANKGINAPYEHTNEGKKFADPNHNFIPEITGVKDRRVQAFKPFDPLKGVTAFDREDGELTSKITVNGSVNVNVPGNYTLEYSVSDSKGGVGKASRIITVTTEEVVNKLPVLSGVQNKEIIIGTPFDVLGGITALDDEDGDLTKNIKVEGTVDNNKLGNYYINYYINYKVIDNDGGVTTATTRVKVIRPEDYVEEFDYYKVYTGGELVYYKGEKYQCTSWTTYGYPDESPWAWKKLPKEEAFTIVDLAQTASKYNTKHGTSGYLEEYDFTKDGIIDIYDITYVAYRI